MKVTIQTPGVKARKDLLELVDIKMQKLGSINERLIEGRVCLKLNKSDTTENKICEIIIMAPGNELFIEKQAQSFPEAIRKAYEGMRRQINDWKSTVRPYRKSRMRTKV
jgi:putative sigma-54 modulation protein